MGENKSINQSVSVIAVCRLVDQQLPAITNFSYKGARKKLKIGQKHGTAALVVISSGDLTASDFED